MSIEHYLENKGTEIQSEPNSEQIPDREKYKDIIEEEKARWVIFQEKVTARLDELARDGDCPLRFLEMQRGDLEKMAEHNLDPETLSMRASGELPSSFFPDADPEAAAIEWVEIVEIGLSDLREFKKRIEETRIFALEKVQPVLDRINRIVTHFEDAAEETAHPSPDLIEKIEQLREFRETIIGHVADFEAKLKEIQELNFTIQNQATAPDTEAIMRELEELLN